MPMKAPILEEGPILIHLQEIERRLRQVNMLMKGFPWYGRDRYSQMETAVVEFRGRRILHVRTREVFPEQLMVRP